MQIEEVMSQLEDYRYQLQQANTNYLKKEEQIRIENNKLLERLEDAERRNEELSQTVLEVSKPLMFQIESLQSTYNKKVASFEDIEKKLSLSIQDLQNRLHASKESEKISKEDNVILRNTVSNLESSLNNAMHEKEMLSLDFEQQKTQHEMELQDLKRKLDALDQKLCTSNQQIQTLIKDNEFLQQKLNVEIEKKKSITNSDSEITAMPTMNAGNESPTASLGRVSISESLSSSFWPGVSL